jgi:hypothetical protein
MRVNGREKRLQKSSLHDLFDGCFSAPDSMAQARENTTLFLSLTGGFSVNEPCLILMLMVSVIYMFKAINCLTLWTQLELQSPGNQPRQRANSPLNRL